MTYGREKSDLFKVAQKPANKAEGAAAESVERRRRVEGNTQEPITHRTQGRGNVSGLERVRERARLRKQERFTALLHHVTEEALRRSYLALKRDAAPGVDRCTWQEYGRGLEERLKRLHEHIHSGTYRALPSRRKLIRKEDGRSRALGIAAVEDKLVQRAVVEVLNAIYEADFLGFSYGFRPKRGQHDALDALAAGINFTRVNWILDADLKSFFDTLSHEWLVRFLKHRIGDPRVLGLIEQWLKAGVMQGDEWEPAESGTPQGATISPVLANLYLHHVFDLWANRWRHREARGNVIIVRYADDSAPRKREGGLMQLH